MDALTLDQAKLERQVSQALETLISVVTTYGLKVLGALVILIVGWILAGFVSRAMTRTLGRVKGIDLTVISFTASLAKYAVLVFTIIAVLASVGVQTASFVAVLGAMGLAIGLALQGTLSHLASGLMLVMFRPFKVGDTVETAGVAGTVRSITIFTTELATADNIKVVIPNGAVWGSTIRNFSAFGERRADIEIAIAHSNDLQKALSLAQAAVAAEARVTPLPAPSISVARLTETAVILSVQAWTKTTLVADVRAALNRAIKDAFTANGIAFPGPPAPRP
ncbi:MAG: mechanosensitive ion channel [Rhodospirillaceae bacterium]|nr:mechanosensitive ion channel [Rhodospirillaceae bacterium]